MPDTIADTTATTTSLTLGRWAQAELETNIDRDWFRVTLTAGKTYHFVVHGSPSSGGTLNNSFVGIYNSAGVFVTGNFNSGVGVDGLVTYTATTSGTYYISAESESQSGSGTYTVGFYDAYSYPQLELTNFGAGASAGGWTSNNQFPRLIGDVTGDGRRDIVAFANDGVYVAQNNTLTNIADPFLNPAFKLANFGALPSAGGWNDNNKYPRQLADISGSFADDIVAFAEDGVYVAVSTALGFNAPVRVLTTYGASVAAGGWNDNNKYPRFAERVDFGSNGDILAFAEDGVYWSEGNGNNTFAAPKKVLAALGASVAVGGWNDNNKYPRMLGDVDNDGDKDIVAFAEDGVYVAIWNNSTKAYAYPTKWTSQYGAAAAFGGWSDNNKYPRRIGDVDGDGRADIIAFAEAGVYVAKSTGTGFAIAEFQLEAFGNSAVAGGWASNDQFPRQVADLNGDGRVEIVGFGTGGTFISWDLTNGVL